MRKIIYIGVILVVFCINAISVNSQITDLLSDAYTITITDDEKVVNQEMLLDDLSNKHNLGLLSIEFYEGMTFYINDVIYKENELNKSTIYTNGISNNRVNIPFVENIQIKPWSSVEENKRFNTEDTYLFGTEDDVYLLSKDIESFNVESTIMRAQYSSNMLYYLLAGLGLSFIVYIVFACMNINRNQKKIMLYKLHGLTIKDYVVRDFQTTKTVVIKGVLIAILTTSLTMIFTHNLSGTALLISIFAAILYVTFCLALYYVIIAKLLGVSKMDTLIRGEVFIVKTSEFLKGILFTSKTILFVVLALATIGITSILSNVGEIRAWQQVSDYYVGENVSPVKYTTREQQEIDYNDIDDYKERVLFVKYMEEHYKGAYVYTLADEFSDILNADSPLDSVVFANPNFLELNGFEISESDKSTVYIPKDYANSQTDIRNAIDAYLSDIAINDLEYSLDYNIVVYDNNDLYSFKYKDGETDIYENPIVYVPGKDANEYNIYVYAYQELMFLSEGEPNSSLYEYYKQYDYQPVEGVEDVVLSKFSEYSKYLYNQLKVLGTSLAMLVISMIVSVFVFIDVIKSYIRINRTQFLMKKLSGKTSFVIYRKIYHEEVVYWCINTVIGLVTLILVSIMKSYTVTEIIINVILYLVLLILIQLLYFVILKKVIYKVENTEIYIAIKGKD